MRLDNRKIMRISLLLLLVTLVSAGVHSQTEQTWHMVKTPVSESITGINFVNPDTGFIITSSGKFARTFDRCKSWDLFTVEPGVSLEDVDFLNSDTGMICGARGRIYVTYNGGYAWQYKGTKDTIPWFFDVAILDSKTAVAVGLSRDPINQFGPLGYRTTDGGDTWTKMEPMGMGYAEMQYNPGGLLYLLSFGELHYSADKGKTWNAYKTTEGNPARALSIVGNTGIICGLKGMCAYSHDAGKTWRPSQQGDQIMFVAAQLVDENTGYIGGTQGTLMKTADGGQTWAPESAPEKFDIFDLFLEGNRLYAAGTDGLMMFKQVK